MKKIFAINITFFCIFIKLLFSIIQQYFKAMTIKLLCSTFLMTTFFSGCSSKSTIDCKGDIRAYEFGREMETWTELRGGGSLEKSIDEYSNEIGINKPYNANNECVIRGYEDAKNGKSSPYNKDGKNWSSF